MASKARKDGHMFVHKLDQYTGRFIRVIAVGTSRLASVILIGMMLIVFWDVFLRYLFNKPISGAYELVEVMMGAVVSLSIAYCGLRKGHVSVELIVEKLPHRVRKIADLLHAALGVIFFTIISYSVAQHTIIIKKSETTTAILSIPIYPFLGMLSFGTIVLALVYFRQFVETLRRRGVE